MNIEVNYLAVFLAAVVAMSLGFFWYSEMAFGKAWMKLKGYTKESMKQAQKEMGKLYGLSFVAALVTGYVLTHVMILADNFYFYPSLYNGLSTAFWMWLGFVMPVQLTATIFGEKKWKLFGIDTGYQLVSLLLMGLVISYL